MILCDVKEQFPSGSFNLAGAEAGSADIHLMYAAFSFHSDRLDIRLPDVVRSSMRMAHIVSEVSCLVTNCTPCHDLHLPSSIVGSFLDSIT